MESPTPALAAAFTTSALLFEHVMLGASLQRLGVCRRDALPLTILATLFIAPETTIDIKYPVLLFVESTKIAAVISLYVAIIQIYPTSVRSYLQGGSPWFCAVACLFDKDELEGNKYTDTGRKGPSWGTCLARRPKIEKQRRNLHALRLRRRKIINGCNNATYTVPVHILLLLAIYGDLNHSKGVPSRVVNHRK